MLARGGHLVTVFERAPVVGPVGTGLLLQPSGQIVMQRLGLLEDLIQNSAPVYELRAFQPNGAKLAHLRYCDAAPDCRAYGVHRGLLFDTLRRAALDEPNIKIILNCEIINRRRANNQIAAIDKNGAEHGWFDFLIAADGSRSTLREVLNPHQPAGEYDFGAMWTIGRCTTVQNHLHQVVDGTKRLLGLLPVGENRCTMFWGLPKSDVEDLRTRGFENWRAEVLKLSALAEEVFDDVKDFDRVIFSRYRHSITRRQFDSHTICIGDAAHSMSPHLGQGANLALLDAERFAAAVADTENFPAACRSFQTTRRAHINYYARLSRFLTPFFQSEGWLLGAGRNIALPLMCRFPPTRGIMAQSMAGIKNGLFAHSLSIDNLPQLTAESETRA